jgi:branched-chain amino acid transport system permease protein
MDEILGQQLVSGIAYGSIYASVALGFTMIWNASAVVNFAQGELVMLGAFIGLTLFVTLGLPFPIAFLAAVVATGVFGLIMERLIVRPVREEQWFATMLVTLGASLVLANSARFIWGAAPYKFPSTFPEDPIRFGILRLVPQHLFVVVGVLALVGAQYLLFSRTLLGKAMRAVAQDRHVASMMGISPDRIVALTWLLNGAIMAAAGILLAPSYYVSFDMGLSITLKAFAATIIGGFGNVIGAIVGGVLLGIIETLGAGYISSDYKDAITFVVLIVVLLVRPTGLLRTEED